MLLLMTLASHMVSLCPLPFLGPGRVPRLFSVVVLVLYISQEALGPGKHAEKEFCKDPPGDGCGNGMPLGKETVPSQEYCLVSVILSSQRIVLSLP